jgi:hypothetical protein
VEGYGDFAEEMEKIVADMKFGETEEDQEIVRDRKEKAAKKREEYYNKKPNLLDKIRSRFNERNNK